MDYSDDEPTRPQGWIFYRAGDGTYHVSYGPGASTDDKTLVKVTEVCEYLDGKLPCLN